VTPDELKKREQVYSASQIHQAVSRVAGEVSEWMRGSKLNQLRLISVLEGARHFTRDLVAALREEAPGWCFMVYEVKVKGTFGTSLLEGRNLDLGGLDLQAFQGIPILIVDDLADSGKTLSLLKRELLEAGAQEVRTAVLIRKWGAQSVGLDFCGLDLNLDSKSLTQQGLKDRWLYGYGMDLDGRQRDLDWVGSIEIKSEG
jgi:hypoxanthine phosphoribosyltransferase